MENINYYPRVYLKPDKTNNSISFSGIRNASVETFQKTFKDVIQKDSGNQKFGFSTDFLDMVCYDIDMVVNSLGCNNKESMDCCISIGSYDAGRDIYLNPRWLLVELKLNSQVAKNDRGDLEDKVIHTIGLIAKGKIEQVKAFIYPIRVYPRKRSLFESWKKGTDKGKYLFWECLSPKGFEDFLRLRQNIPY